jgi:hypothetical protein
MKSLVPSNTRMMMRSAEVMSLGYWALGRR